MNTFKVGQELYWEPSDSRDKHRACMVKIVKVGRLWLEIDNGQRVDKENLIQDCKYGAAARCYVNKEAREAQVLDEKTWYSLRKRMNTKPNGVTAERIMQAAALLGIAL